MGTKVTALEEFHDDDGNTIEYTGTKDHGPVSILFVGKNNRLVVHPKAKLRKLTVRFDCDNATLTIGANTHDRSLMLGLRLGQDSSIRLGHEVSSTDTVVMSAVEGASITVGHDTMFASACQVRTDDGHPIFDVHTGKRINEARDVNIGSHVWLGRESVLLSGATVGDGSVVGYRSIVTKRIPNNVVAAGTPAKVIRKDIAWERPHLSLVEPFYKPDVTSVKKSEKYWNLTRSPSSKSPVRNRLVRGIRAFIQRLRR